MIGAIIKNKDNSYEYINIVNNKLSFIHINKNGVDKSNKQYIDNFFKSLFFNDNCSYIEKYKDYDVYYDKVNNLKHFMKNEIENLELFYTFNGIDAKLYNSFNYKEPSNSLRKEKRNKKVQKIITNVLLGAQILIFSKSILSMVYLESIKSDIKKNDYKLENAIGYTYDPLEVDYYKYIYGKMTYQDAINYIYESNNLTKEQKEFLANEELLQDVFSYYNDTALEYVSNLNFKDISIVYEEMNDGKGGYYSCEEPNIIHISKTFEGNLDANEYTKGVISHEYIHLLQVPVCQYTYIVEASAELLAHEYFDEPIIAYYNGVKNLQLLIEIIGPEPIIKMIFAGDDNTFNNILKNNLSNSEYEKLISYFQDSSIIDSSNKENDEIKELLCTLYKNIYGKDITEDQEILYSFYYDNYFFIEDKIRYFLNTRKMDETNEIRNRFSTQYERMISQTYDKPNYGKHI